MFFSAVHLMVKHLTVLQSLCYVSSTSLTFTASPKVGIDKNKTCVKPPEFLLKSLNLFMCERRHKIMLK